MQQMLTCFTTMDTVSDYFSFIFFSISYGAPRRTGDLKLCVCLFHKCYSLNDVGCIIVLGGGSCSAL